MFLNSLLVCVISTVQWSGATSICDGIIFLPTLIIPLKCICKVRHSVSCLTCLLYKYFTLLWRWGGWKFEEEVVVPGAVEHSRITQVGRLFGHSVWEEEGGAAKEATADCQQVFQHIFRPSHQSWENLLFLFSLFQFLELSLNILLLPTSTR